MKYFFRLLDVVVVALVLPAVAAVNIIGALRAAEMLSNNEGVQHYIAYLLFAAFGLLLWWRRGKLMVDR